MIDVLRPLLERLDELHEKYGLSKTREAEDMCNYSEYLMKKQEEKDKLEFLEQLDIRHYSDNQIMDLLRINADYLKYLRNKLQERQTVATAD